MTKVVTYVTSLRPLGYTGMYSSYLVRMSDSVSQAAILITEADADLMVND